MKKKVITSAILTIALAFSLLLGATYALFTSESRNSIDITSGKVSVEAVVDEIQTKQLDEAYVAGLKHTFAGDVEFVDNQVVLKKLVPGDGVKFTVKLTNESNIAVKYRVRISSVTPEGVDRDDSLLLFSGLSFKVNERDFSSLYSYKSDWQDLAATDQPENITFEIELPGDAGNEYQDLSTSIVLVVEAIQGNAPVTSDEEIIRYDASEGFAVDESKKMIWVFDGADMFKALALIQEDDSLYSGYNGVTLMDDIDLNESIIIGG